METAIGTKLGMGPACWRAPALKSVRERLRQQGAEALSEQELLALVLGHGSTNGEPLALAGLLLAEGGGLSGLARKNLLELSAVRGVGPARACLLQAALELGRRAVAPHPQVGRPVRSSAEVAEWFRCRLQDSERESVHALLLDSRHRLIGQVKIGEGSWNGCQVDAKVVFSACLRHGASGLILVHNHPSGDPTPSREDLELTERLVRAGCLLEIRIVDHLIVSRGGYTSLADGGFI